MLKWLNLERSTARGEERIPHYSQSLSLETIRPKELFISTTRNVFFYASLAMVQGTVNALSLDKFHAYLSLATSGAPTWGCGKRSELSPLA